MPLVLTSHDQLGDTGAKIRIWIKEFADFFNFKDTSADIILPSPKGGRPPPDRKSTTTDSQIEATLRFPLGALLLSQKSLRAKTMLCFIPEDMGCYGISGRIGIPLYLFNTRIQTENRLPPCVTRPQSFGISIVRKPLFTLK